MHERLNQSMLVTCSASLDSAAFCYGTLSAAVSEHEEFRVKALYARWLQCIVFSKQKHQTFGVKIFHFIWLTCIKQVNLHRLTCVLLFLLCVMNFPIYLIPAKKMQVMPCFRLIVLYFSKIT